MKSSILKLVSNRIFGKFSKSDKFLFLFVKNTLKVTPYNIALYKLAVRHRSKSRLLKGIVRNSNERLEFLGDAILNSVITDILFRKFPYKSEGFLTELRARIVNRSYLNETALKIGIDKYINCSSGIKQSYNKNDVSLGNAFEALIGAIYLDRGYNSSYRCIKFIVDRYTQLEVLANTETNYKSRLLEFCQKYNKTIKFELSQSNNKTLKFMITIFIDEESISTALGHNRKDAEKKASEIAYKQLLA